MDFGYSDELATHSVVASSCLHGQRRFLEVPVGNTKTNHQLKIETKKEKKRKPLVLLGTKGPAHVARPGGLFSPGWYYQPGLKVSRARSRD